MAIQTFPRPVNPKIKKQTDDQLAKVGQVNQLVKDVNQLNITGPSPAGIPFEFYPPAGLTTGGVKFAYTDGVDLLSYHIKGIQPLSIPDNTFSQYLCSVSFPDNSPFLFPGSITGTIQGNDGYNIISIPLSGSGQITLGQDYATINSFQLNLYDYGDNPQPDGSYYYALVATGAASATNTLSTLVAYDFEFLLPNFAKAPTIFQD